MSKSSLTLGVSKRSVTHDSGGASSQYRLGAFGHPFVEVLSFARFGEGSEKRTLLGLKFAEFVELAKFGF